jgi:hypothetical protein
MENLIINLFGGIGLALVLPLATLTLIVVIFKMFGAR